ncbi:protein eceriferum 1 [Quercus suber]|uniref:Protein eceriferum 1 n=1 Tax=Quercus suber TaxID=58331 RepID=A0AAW0M0V1_QUESU
MHQQEKVLYFYLYLIVFYMATKPGILTDWPWTPLGRFKYVILAPWAIHSTYSFIVKDKSESSLSLFLIFPFLLWRMLHNQIWISLSRREPTIVEDRWSNYDDSSTFWSCRVSLLLAPQSTAPPLSLLSLPFPSPFFNCHRAYNL